MRLGGRRRTEDSATSGAGAEEENDYEDVSECRVNSDASSGCSGDDDG